MAKYELRQDSDKKVLASGTTQTTFFAAAVKVAPDTIDKSTVYVNNLIVMTGKEFNEFVDYVASGVRWGL